MHHSSARIAIGLASLSFGMLGVCLILPGALLPLLVDHFGMRLVEAGSLLALQPIGYLLAVSASSRVIRKIGLQPALSLSFIVAGLGFLGFGYAANFTVGAAMMFITGVGIGTIEVGTNTLLINVGGERTTSLLNFAHVFFGLGSITTPAVATWAVASGMDWSHAFFATGAATVAIGVLWSLIPTVQNHNAVAATGHAHRWNYLMLLALMLGVYVGVEMGIGNWLTKFMIGERGTSLTTAGTALSCYWGGLTVGRIFLIFLARRIREEPLLLGLTIFSTVSLLLALIAGEATFTTAGFALTGLGFSGIFPAVIALGGRAHPDDSAAATSVLIAGAGVGGIVIPWMMSGISDLLGLAQGMLFFTAMSAVMIALAAVIGRGARPVSSL